MTAALILLVDDHEDTRMVVSRLLATKGYKVLGAASKAEAEKLFREKPVDLLISDLGLPDGSGHDLIRALQAERPVKGIAMSGYGSAEDMARSREAGFQRHLVKPVEFAELVQSIQVVLAQN